MCELQIISKSHFFFLLPPRAQKGDSREGCQLHSFSMRIQSPHNCLTVDLSCTLCICIHLWPVYLFTADRSPSSLWWGFLTKIDRAICENIEVHYTPRLSFALKNFNWCKIRGLRRILNLPPVCFFCSLRVSGTLMSQTQTATPAPVHRTEISHIVISPLRLDLNNIERVSNGLLLNIMMHKHHMTERQYIYRIYTVSLEGRFTTGCDRWQTAPSLHWWVIWLLRPSLKSLSGLSGAYYHGETQHRSRLDTQLLSETVSWILGTEDILVVGNKIRLPEKTTSLSHPESHWEGRLHSVAGAIHPSIFLIFQLYASIMCCVSNNQWENTSSLIWNLIS